MPSSGCHGKRVREVENRTVMSRNNSIDMFRLISSILVVAIHTKPFQDLSPRIGYCVTEIVPRIAVPFFFAVAGYYYIKALMDNKKIFVRYLTKHLVTYSLWSIVYFLIYLLQQVCHHSFSCKQVCWYIVKSYFINGSEYHLWFFPALIFSVAITTVVYKLKIMKFFAPFTIVLYLFGCFSCAYNKLAVKIPLLCDIIAHPRFFFFRRVIFMGLPFFVLGYFMNLFLQRYPDFHNKKVFLLYAICILLYLLEIRIVIIAKLQSNIIMTTMLYPLLFCTLAILFNNPLPACGTAAKLCRALANFTYYSHPICIWVCTYLTQMSIVEIGNTLKFVVTITFALSGGFILYKFNRPFTNRFIF